MGFKQLMTTWYCQSSTRTGPKTHYQKPIIKNMDRVNIQSVPSAKYTDEDLELVPGCSIAAAHCSSQEDGSNAENKFHSSSYM